MKIKANSCLMGTNNSRKEKKNKLLREVIVKIGLN